MSLGPMTAHPDPVPAAGFLPCRCGTDLPPADGWMANGKGHTHYVHCPSCGHWAHGSSDDNARFQWNRDAMWRAA